jgi:hypothetical protein
MLTNSEFRELLNLFEKHNARYLVVGGYAVMKYSAPLRVAPFFVRDPYRYPSYLLTTLNPMSE